MSGSGVRSSDKLLGQLITEGLAIQCPPNECFPQPCVKPNSGISRACLVHMHGMASTLVEVTPKLWDSLPSTPLLIEHGENEYTNPHDARFGARWNDLPLHHKKWVLDHPADYCWQVRDQYPPHQRFSFAPGQTVPDRDGCTPSMEIWVSTPAFLVETERRIFAIRMQNAEATGWASFLQEVIGLRQAEDFNFFGQARPDAISFGTGALFGRDPDKFEQNLLRGRDTLETQLRRAQEGLKALEFVQHAIAQRGGWPAVILQYREWLREQLIANPQAGL
jgi:hypothetical protein